MLVTVSGPHAVGKTTVCNLFKARNPGWDILPEILDTTIKPPSNSDLRMVWFMNQYVERERMLRTMRGRNILADRDWIDCLVYASGSPGYDVIERLYLSMERTEPDLRIIITLSDDQIIQRVNKRNRDLKDDWKENDVELIKTLNEGFCSYYDDYKDLKPVILLDGSRSPVDMCKKLEKSINDIMQPI